MGTFRVTVEIGDPKGERYESVESLVDTGASYTQVSTSVLERLGVIPHTRATFVLANGSRYERPVGRTWVRLDGRSEITLVVFGPEEIGAILGAYTLEGFLLAPDPVNRRLVPVPGLLM